MSALKRATKRAVASPLGWRVVSRILRQPGVTVLTYHRITRPGDLFPGLDLDRFRAQMTWLRDRCTTIASDALLDACRRPNRDRPVVLITFDDGYRDYHDNAYPVLRELGLPAVVFLATSFMDKGGMIWTDQVYWACHASDTKEVRLPWDDTVRFDLTCVGERERLAVSCKGYLKDVPDRQRTQWLDRLLEALHVRGREHEVKRQTMTWDEVRSTLTGTEYGGHTHTHPILSQLDGTSMEEEIRLCRERIEAETGVTPRTFAYPNGRAVDYNADTKRLLRKHGFVLAFTTVEGINGAAVDPLEIRRVPTHAGTLGDFACLVSNL